MGYLKLTEALKIMESGNPFDITFYTADKKRRTGGEKIQLQNVTTTSKEQRAEPSAERTIAQAVDRNPGHYRHSTRNLVLENNQIRKCHIRLITELNGQKVIY